MPELNPSPNFPVTEKPQLSPNPKQTHEIKDGGRGTPTIVMTEPKEQVETRPCDCTPFDPSHLEEQIASLKCYEITGDEDDLTIDDLKAIVEGDCDCVAFKTDERLIGQVTYKYKTGSNYFANILLDTGGAGLAYKTLIYEYAGVSLVKKVVNAMGNIAYLSSAPNADNTNGLLQMVVLDEEPATYFDGFLYFVTESAE